MNNMNRAQAMMQEEDIPQLQVVSPKKGATNPKMSSAPFVLPSPLPKRSFRPELSALGWSNRAIRLAGGKSGRR
jgi:hypothetical protein